MRFMVLGLLAGLMLSPLTAVAEDGDFGASMFTNEEPAAFGDNTTGDILADEGSFLDAIEPAGGGASILDDGWLPATEELRLTVPEDELVPGMGEKTE